MATALHTVGLGGLGPDVVPPGPGVLPQELLRGAEAGLGLSHGQVRLLARGEFISHLIVILGLEPDKMTGETFIKDHVLS